MAEKERKVPTKEKHKQKQRISKEEETSSDDQEVLKLMQQLTVPAEEIDEPDQGQASSIGPIVQEESTINDENKISQLTGQVFGESSNLEKIGTDHCEVEKNYEEHIPGKVDAGRLAVLNEQESCFIEGKVSGLEQFNQKEENTIAEKKEVNQNAENEKGEGLIQDELPKTLSVSRCHGELLCPGVDIKSKDVVVPGNRIHGSIAKESSENISKKTSDETEEAVNREMVAVVKGDTSDTDKDGTLSEEKEHCKDNSETKTDVIEEEADDVIVNDKISSRVLPQSKNRILTTNVNFEEDKTRPVREKNTSKVEKDVLSRNKPSLGEDLMKENEEATPDDDDQNENIFLGVNVSTEEVGEQKVSEQKDKDSLETEITTTPETCEKEVFSDPGEGVTLESCISENAAEFFSSQQTTLFAGGLLSNFKLWTTTPEVVIEELLHVKPQSLFELHSLFPNQQQTFCQQYMDQFLMIIEQHEKQSFYELVQTYYTSCNKLFDINHDLKVHMRELRRVEDSVWQTVEFTEKGHGECSDRARVEGQIQYTKEVFSPENLNTLGNNLKVIRNVMHDPFTILSYQKHFAKLHVEAYLVDLCKKHPEWQELCESSIVANLEVTPNQAESAASLKSCLSVLFAFQRKPVKDPEFLDVTQNWISKLVAILLRVGPLEDHLYILNQVMRCPAGIEKWAVHFVQALPPPICVNAVEIFGHPLLDHYVHQLASLLMPIKGRKNLLYQLQKSVPEDGSGTTWTLLDTDGEEEYDPLNSWYYLDESDLIALLNQLPLSSVMKHILFSVDGSSGNITYSPEYSFMEGNISKLMAFATALVNILGDSLQVFGIPRYKQFHRRLVTMMRSLLSFVSDHVTNCQTFLTALPRNSQQKIQVEFDSLFFRVVSAFTCVSGFSSWQYLTEMPFVQVSETNMWKILWKIYFLQESEFNPSDSLDSEEFCQMLCDFEKLQCLHEKLLTLETSAVLHLLSTFCSMACSRNTFTLFVQTIIAEVFYLGYINTRTRDFSSKQAKEVLSMICKKHPRAMSDIFMHTSNNLTCIGKVSVFLYSGLPLWLWKPSAEEIDTLGKWLVNNTCDSVENHLARSILEGLNWGTDSNTGQLFIKKQSHFCIMKAVVEAYKEHLPSHNLSNILTDKFCKTNSCKGTEDSKDLMALFLWKIAFQLDLGFSAEETSTVSISEFCMERHMKTEKVLKIEEYFSLVGGKCGRTMDDFCVDGINHLDSLAEKPHVLPAIHALSHVLKRLHYPQQIQKLAANKRFSSIVARILTFDDTKSQLFAAEFPGPVKQLVCLLIQKHVHQREEYSWIVEMGTFWLHTITTLTDWRVSRGHAYVLNKLLMITFSVPEFMDVCIKHFSELYKNHQMVDHSEGLLSSVVTWLSRGYSGNSFPPLLQELFCWEFPYLMYYMLTVESLWEKENSLWRCMSELFQKNPAASLDATFFSKVVKSLNLSKSPSVENLSIFRWAQLLVSTDISCFILPLVCQKFFIMYLGRPQGGKVPANSVGKRVFSQGQRVALLEKATKRMTLAADTYQKVAVNDTAKQSTLGKDNLQQQIQDRNFHQNLTKFFRATVYWLSEPLLHEDMVFISDLPFHFDKDRLLSVIERDQNLWYDLVDWNSLNKEMQKMPSHWRQTFSQLELHQDRKSDVIQKTATQKLLQRLNYDDVTEPPPTPEPFMAPFPDVPLTLLQDKERLQYVVKSELEHVTKQANEYYLSTTEKETLDLEYIQLLPGLFKEHPAEKTVVVACTSIINPLHRCKGPASICLTFKGTVRDEIVNHKVNENRNRFKQVQTIGLASPSEGLCHSLGNIEHMLGELAKQYRLARNGALEKYFQESGHCLYFILTAYLNKFTKYCPATRHFFTSCLEKLGEEFVIGKPLQTEQLLKTLLNNKYLLDMTSHHFLPNCNPDNFIQLYEDVTGHFMVDDYQVTVTLLSKFKVKQWLAQQSVGISQTRSLLKVTMLILGQFGKRPAQQITLLCELCRLTLVELTEFRFPQLYGDVLHAILNGGSSGKMMPDVWSDFVYTLLSDKSENQEMTRIDLLSFSQIKESIDVLSKHFHLLRVQSSDNTGIYPKWRAYITPLCSYIEHICKAFIQWRMKWLETANDGQSAIMEIWEVLDDLFRPWMGCYSKENDVLFPWVEADKEPASSVVKVFVHCVTVLHSKLRAYQVEVFPLNLMWSWYIQNVCKTNVPSVVQSVFQEQMSCLPWMEFQPTFDDLRSFTEEFERKNKKSCDFMTTVICQVLWTDNCNAIITYSKGEQDFHRKKAYLSQLFHILVMLPFYAVDQKEEVSKLLLSVEMLDWQTMDAASFQHTAQCFTNSCGSSSEFIKRSQPHAVVLRMLKKASGMLCRDADSFNLYTPKMTCYVRSISQIALKLSDDKPSEKEQIKAILMNTLTDLESLTAFGDSNEGAVSPLCVELLTVFNMCGAKKLLVIKAIVFEWIAHSPGSALLLPLLKAGCRTIVNIGCMVQLTEVCMDGYFEDCSTDSTTSWATALKHFQIPEFNLPVFVEEALACCAFLTLYAHILQMLTASNSGETEICCLCNLAEWTRTLRSDANKEHKLLLWWWKMILLCDQQCGVGINPEELKAMLSGVVSSVWSLGEDRESDGFFGTLGFGKKSTFAVKFRVICKVLAMCLNAALEGDSRMPSKRTESVTSLPDSPTKTSDTKKVTSQHVAHIEKLLASSGYGEYKSQLEAGLNFVKVSDRSLKCLLQLVKSLVTQLYPGNTFLTDIYV